MHECLFCNILQERIILENKLSYAIRDNFPVTHLHSLIIPKRHISEYFSLTEKEILSCNSLLNKTKDLILKEDDSVEGFNIGVNSGEVAGQTIFHCHIHLIPRRKEDVENSTGGVRGVIPGKQKY